MNNDEVIIENRIESLQLLASSIVSIAFAILFGVSLAVGYNKENTYAAIFGLLICVPWSIYALYKFNNSMNSSVSINNDTIEFYSDGTCTAHI